MAEAIVTTDPPRTDYYPRFAALIESLCMYAVSDMDALDDIGVMLKEIETQPFEGRPHWQGNYLYWEYPSVNGKKRERKYIGTNPQKQAEMLQRVPRSARHKKLSQEKEQLECRLRRILFQLEVLVTNLKEGS